LLTQLIAFTKGGGVSYIHYQTPYTNYHYNTHHSKHHHANEFASILLTGDNFESLVKQSNDMWLVAFLDPDCNSCGHQWNKVNEMLPRSVNVGYVLSKDLARRYGVDTFPTIVKFPEGEKNSFDIFSGSLIQTNDIIQWALPDSAGHQTSQGFCGLFSNERSFTIQSTNFPEKFGGEALGYYYLHSDFTVNQYPVWKHQHFEIYVFYNTVSDTYCFGHDPLIDSCVMRVTFDGTIVEVWDSERKAFNEIASIGCDQELEEINSSFPSKLHISSNGALGQKYPYTMGVYELVSQCLDRPVYRQVNGGNVLKMDKEGSWVIQPHFKQCEQNEITFYGTENYRGTFFPTQEILNGFIMVIRQMTLIKIMSTLKTT